MSHDESTLEHDLQLAHQRLANCDEDDIKCKTINQIKIDILKKSADTLKKVQESFWKNQIKYY